jgi:hypothetical protein
VRQKSLSQNDAVLKAHSVTCKVCEGRFESFGDMQKHVLTEHLQKGEIPLEKKTIVIDTTAKCIQLHMKKRPNSQ